MYEPPHFTKPRLAPIAKRSGEEQSGALSTKPAEASSLSDMAETLKEGMRMLAEQVAGLTARVDDMAARLPPDAPAWRPINRGPVNVEVIADEIRSVMPKGWAVRPDSSAIYETIVCSNGGYCFAITKAEIEDNLYLCLAVERAKHQDELAAAVDRLSKLLAGAEGLTGAPTEAMRARYQQAVSSAAPYADNPLLPREPFTVVTWQGGSHLTDDRGRIWSHDGSGWAVDGGAVVPQAGVVAPIKGWLG